MYFGADGSDGSAYRAWSAEITDLSDLSVWRAAWREAMAARDAIVVSAIRDSASCNSRRSEISFSESSISTTWETAGAVELVDMRQWSIPSMS